ncbi:MAG: DNA glycosylase AlkZ-like family protein, partial [Gemmatimonadales bacterium]
MTRAHVASATIARLRSQLLDGPPADSAKAVVERLLAVQAQDARGFRLAIRSRSTGLSAVDVDRALSQDRSLVVTWLNRGTLHLVRSEDYWWLHRLTAGRSPQGSERRLRQEGVDARQAVRGVE